jgi:hypothetical protein
MGDPRNEIQKFLQESKEVPTCWKKMTPRYQKVEMPVIQLNLSVENVIFLPLTPERQNLYERLGQEMQNAEKRILSRGRVCTIDQISPSSLAKAAHQLSGTGLNKLLREDFYQPDTMKTILATMKSVLFLPPTQTSAASNERIRDWFRRLELLSESSAYGLAFRGYPDSQDIPFQQTVPFIIKVPKDPAVSLIHEVFIGSLILNRMRDLIPNFAYVFGGFSCLPPVLDKSHTVRTWCSENDYTMYAIYENVIDSVPLRKFVETCSFDDFLNVTLQVFYAFQMAYKRFGFTHYDLHFENVLIRRLPYPVSIIYETENGKEYLTTQNLAMVIDYGLSYARLHEEDKIGYGISFVTSDPKIEERYRRSRYFDPSGPRTYLTEVGIIPDRGYPLYDIYFYFNNATASLGARFSGQITAIMRYITNETPLGFIQGQSANSYRLPRGLEQLDYYFITSILRRTFANPFITREARTRIWNCNEARCLSGGEVLSQLTVKMNRFSDYFEFVDLLKVEKKESVVAYFDGKKAFENYRKHRDMIAENARNLSRLTEGEYARLNRAIRQPHRKEDVKQMLMNFPVYLADLFDRWHRFAYYRGIVYQVENILGNERNKREAIEDEKIFQDIVGWYFREKRSIDQIFAHLKRYGRKYFEEREYRAFMTDLGYILTMLHLPPRIEM